MTKGVKRKGRMKWCWRVKDSRDDGGGGLHHTLQQIMQNRTLPIVQHTILQNTTDYTGLEYRIIETALKAIPQATLKKCDVVDVVENAKECM